jgi:short-subunit dehydrogenase
MPLVREEPTQKSQVLKGVCPNNAFKTANPLSWTQMANTSDFKGKWALVTGASAGIGAAIARELAGDGAKLILTARRQDRLEALAHELTSRGTEVRIVAADLRDPEAPRRIYDATEGLGVAVDILINNAGLGQFGVFARSPIEQELAQIRVNCEAMVHLSRLFVPHMVERRRGWVLIVASTASFQPIPYLNTYAATKVFDRFFSQALTEEVKEYGVKVTALCPGPTESEFWDISRASAFKRRIQPTQEVARLGIDALARGKRTIIANMQGRMTAFMVRFLPIGLITWFVQKAARGEAYKA